MREIINHFIPIFLLLLFPWCVDSSSTADDRGNETEKGGVKCGKYRGRNREQTGILGPVACVIDEGTPLPSSPSSKGQSGDFLIFNDRVQFVVQGLGREFGFALSGGNIIDAGMKDDAKELLAQIFTYLDDTFPRQFIYEDAKVLGSGGSEAVVEVTGYDSENRDIRARTRYILYPDNSYLTIMTEITNHGRQKVEDYEFGDAIEWGGVTFFVPHFGTDLSGKTTPLEWVIGGEGNLYYGWTANGEDLYAHHGASWTDFIVGKFDLMPEERKTFERFLVVGSSPQEVLSTILGLRGTKTGYIEGFVSSKNGQVENGRILLFDPTGNLFSVANIGKAGYFSSPLPSGSYRFMVDSPSRRSIEGEGSFEIKTEKVVTKNLILSGEGRVKVTVTRDDGRSTPCKLTFSGIRGTPDPIFGPRYDADGALNTIFSSRGDFDVRIPPGDYLLTASRGIEWSIFQKRIEIREDETLKVKGKIKRVVDTEGYLSADLHQHSSCSIDSMTTLKDLLVANIAEGVEIIALTNHDTLCRDEYTSALLKEFNSDIKVMFGQEITALFGHFNIFPLLLKPEFEMGGFFRRRAKSPTHLLTMVREMNAAPIIQLNHPRAKVDGYFNIMNFNPENAIDREGFPPEIDLIEIANGKRMKDTAAVLKDWFFLLNAGKRVIGVGNSDSHNVTTQERGYPRTYIRSKKGPGDITDEEVVKALKEGVESVTNGPFVLVNVNGVHPAGMAVVKNGVAKVHITIQAPGWISVDTVEFIRNGKIEKRFTIDPHKIWKGGKRYVKTFEHRVGEDSWVCVIVRGKKGLDPVVPSYKGTVITPLAITNPVWIDVDGNGRFDPPL